MPRGSAIWRARRLGCGGLVVAALVIACPAPAACATSLAVGIGFGPDRESWSVGVDVAAGSRVELRLPPGSVPTARGVELAFLAVTGAGREQDADLMASPCAGDAHPGAYSAIDRESGGCSPLDAVVGRHGAARLRLLVTTDDGPRPHVVVSGTVDGSEPRTRRLRRWSARTLPSGSAVVADARVPPALRIDGPAGSLVEGERIAASISGGPPRARVALVLAPSGEGRVPFADQPLGRFRLDPRGALVARVAPRRNGSLVARLPLARRVTATATSEELTTAMRRPAVRARFGRIRHDGTRHVRLDIDIAPADDAVDVGIDVKEQLPAGGHHIALAFASRAHAVVFARVDRGATTISCRVWSDARDGSRGISAPAIVRFGAARR